VSLHRARTFTCTAHRPSIPISAHARRTRPPIDGASSYSIRTAGVSTSSNCPRRTIHTNASTTVSELAGIRIAAMSGLIVPVTASVVSYASAFRE
jgi:hypothetical protein